MPTTVVHPDDNDDEMDPRALATRAYRGSIGFGSMDEETRADIGRAGLDEFLPTTDLDGGNK